MFNYKYKRVKKGLSIITIEMRQISINDIITYNMIYTYIYTHTQARHPSFYQHDDDDDDDDDHKL